MGRFIGPAPELEEGDRHPRAPARTSSSSRESRAMAIIDVQADHRPAAAACRARTSTSITKGDAREERCSSTSRDRRPQQLRPHHLALPRRRPQAALPHHRLQAQQDRRARPRSSAIEYDPNRTARIALLHYADGEKRYILAPDGLERRRHGDRRRATPTSSRATPAAALHPARHDDPQRRAQDRRAARQLVPLGRRRRAADGQGGRLGPAPPALGRDAPGPPRLPRHHRPGRQRRARATSRAARPAARAGWAGARTTAASP